jgi:hypothetical protein
MYGACVGIVIVLSVLFCSWKKEEKKTATF